MAISQMSCNFSKGEELHFINTKCDKEQTTMSKKHDVTCRPSYHIWSQKVVLLIAQQQ